MPEVPRLFLAVICSTIYGIGLLLLFIYQVIRKGPARMFFYRCRNVRPEILRNSEYGTHQYICLPNSRMKLHCVVGGQSDKPLMLFLHGFPEFWYSWRHQIKEFSKDYKTVAVDMRGYGESDKPFWISEYTTDKLVDDIHQLLAELGHAKCILVGHDWGGGIAWRFAAVHPECVQRLIICNIPHPLAIEKHIRTALSQMRKSWYMFFFQWPILPELCLCSDDLKTLETLFSGRTMGAKRGTFTLEDIEAFKYTFSTYGDWVGPLNFYRAAVRYSSPIVASALRGKIVVPTLLIWGNKDPALEQKAAEMSSNYVEDFKLELIDGASHWVQQEEPRQVNTLIRRYLDDRS